MRKHIDPEVRSFVFLALLTAALFGIIMLSVVWPDKTHQQHAVTYIQTTPELLQHIEPAGGLPSNSLSTDFSAYEDFDYLDVNDALAIKRPVLYLGDFSNKVKALAYWKEQQQAIAELFDFELYLGVLKSDKAETSMPLIATLKSQDLPLSLQDYASRSACEKIRDNFDFCVLEQISWPSETKQDHNIYAGVNVAGSDEPPMLVSEESFKRMLALKAPKAAKDLALNLGLDTMAVSDGLVASQDKVLEQAKGDLKWASYDERQRSTVRAAMDAAYNVVNTRYIDVIRTMGDGLNNSDTESIKAVALGLTGDVLEAAALDAFTAFVEDRFGPGQYNQNELNTLQSIFIGRFTSAATETLKTAGKQVTRELIRQGGFKAGVFDSALLKQVETDLAEGLINAAEAAAKNSQFAALRNLELEIELGSDSKPKYSALTIQPLYDSPDQRKVAFAQLSYAHENERNTFNAGLSYRFMPLNYKYLFGVNSFVDYQDPYDHWRASIGADVKTSLYGAAVNYYKTLSDWRDRGDGYQEHSLDGYDLELSGRLPQLPALEFFAKAYKWQKVQEENDDITGKEVSVEYTPVPAFTLRGFANDETDRDPEYGVSVRYNHKFGAPQDYALDKQEQHRLKNVAERRFEKVRRSNEIRVEERIAPNEDIVATNSISTGQFNAASTGLPYSVGGNPVSANTDIPFDTAITIPNGEFAIVSFSNGAIANVSASGAGDVVFEFNASTLTVTATNGGFIQFISSSGGISVINVPGGTVNLLGTDVDVTDDGTTTSVQVRAGSIEVVADVGGGTQNYNQGQVATLNIGSGALSELTGASLTTYQENVFTNLDTQKPLIVDDENAAPFVSQTPELITGPQFVGNNTDIELTFSKAVTVTGAPFINALIDANARSFIYQPAESSFTKLVFRHVYVAGDVGATTLTIDDLDLNGGTIQSTDNSLDALTAYTQTVLTINDETLPTLDSSSPADEAIGFDRRNDIVLTFSEDMVAGSGNITITDLTDGSDTRVIAITDGQISIVNNVITIDPTADLEVDTSFEITLGNTVLEDAAGNGFAGLGSGDLNFNTVDLTVPVLQSFARQTPTDSETNADSLIYRVSFDEDVQNVDTADFTANGTTATITNVSAVDASTYDVTISGGDLASLEATVGLDLAGGQDITDVAGNALPAGEPATDETYLVDNTAPSLNLGSSSPLNGAIQVTRNASPDITLNFTEANGTLVLGTGNITITDTDDGSDVRVIAASDSQVSINGLNIEIDLTTELEYAENYEITFDASFVEDSAGNAATALTGGNLAYKTVNLEEAMVVDLTITPPADNLDENNINGSGVTFPATGSFVLAFDLNFPASPTGLLFECGGAGQGQFIGINGSVLRARGGEGGSLPPDTDMAFVDVPLTSIPAGDHTLLVEYDYAAPEITIWLNEDELGRDGPSGGALESNRWSGGDNCAVVTTSTTSITTGEDTTVFNGTLLNPVRLYSGQTVP